MPPKSTAPDPDAIAVAALAYLAGDPERLARFLALTGLGPQNLRKAAASPGFLKAVLDYLAGDEALLQGFAADQGLDPREVAAARATGGGRMA
jgi:hypothetical protein